MLYGDFSEPLGDRAACVRSRELLIAHDGADSTYADVQLRFAEAYFDEGNLSAAYEHAARALTINSEYMKAQLLRVRILIEQGDFSHAGELVQPLCVKYDRYADLRYLYAVVLFFSGEYAAALTELRQGLEINERYQRARMLMLIVYQAVGRVEEFVRESEKCTDVRGDSSQFFSSGLTEYEKRHLASATLFFESAYVCGYQKDISAYNAACGYSRLFLFDRAEALIDRAVSKNGTLSDRVRSDEDLKPFRFSPHGRRFT